MKNYRIDLTKDVYYQNNYSELYLENGDELFEFVYKENKERIIFKSIKRQIKKVAGINLPNIYYDLETPYGYGGPFTLSEDYEFIKRGFKEYRKYCISQNIVCEFIRFHPFNNLSQYEDLFDFIKKERTVVIVDLEQEQIERRASYSKTTRNIVKKYTKELDVNNQKNTNNFFDLYCKTMDKNKATSFYYFDKLYFKKISNILNIEQINIMYQENLVSSGFFMYGTDIGHYHLSANNQEFNKKNGNYVLLDHAFERAKSHGCSYMLLGGGRTNSKDDNLFKFKSKFSKETLPFFIAGISFMPEIKSKLNNIWDEMNIANSKEIKFQQYRV